MQMFMRVGCLITRVLAKFQTFYARQQEWHFWHRLQLIGLRIISREMKLRRMKPSTHLQMKLRKGHCSYMHGVNRESASAAVAGFEGVRGGQGMVSLQQDLSSEFGITETSEMRSGERSCTQTIYQKQESLVRVRESTGRSLLTGNVVPISNMEKNTSIKLWEAKQESMARYSSQNADLLYFRPYTKIGKYNMQGGRCPS